MDTTYYLDIVYLVMRSFGLELPGGDACFPPNVPENESGARNLDLAPDITHRNSRITPWRKEGHSKVYRRVEQKG